MEECSVLIYPLIMSSSIYYGTCPHRCNNAQKKIGVKMVSNQEKVMIIRKKSVANHVKIKVCKKIPKKLALTS